MAYVSTWQERKDMRRKMWRGCTEQKLAVRMKAILEDLKYQTSEIESVHSQTEFCMEKITELQEDCASLTGVTNLVLSRAGEILKQAQVRAEQKIIAEDCLRPIFLQILESVTETTTFGKTIIINQRMMDSNFKDLKAEVYKVKNELSVMKKDIALSQDSLKQVVEVLTENIASMNRRIDRMSLQDSSRAINQRNMKCDLTESQDDLKKMVVALSTRLADMDSKIDCICEDVGGRNRVPREPEATPSPP